MEIEAALVRAVAPSDLADAIIGDLHERRAALARTLGDDKALATCRSDALRSFFSLLAHNALRSLSDNWIFALMSAAVTCAVCVATIPLWGHIGMGGAGYHVLRLAIIGLVLGSIPRASVLSCVFLLLLIGVSDWAMGARETTFLVLQDGIILVSMLVALRLMRLIRTVFFRVG